MGLLDVLQGMANGPRGGRTAQSGGPTFCLSVCWGCTTTRSPLEGSPATRLHDYKHDVLTFRFAKAKNSLHRSKGVAKTNRAAPMLFLPQPIRAAAFLQQRSRASRQAG